jgi:hypothetical protein
MFNHTQAITTLSEERPADTRPKIEILPVDPSWPEEFFSWFVNRKYFCIQSNNPGNSGKHFYFPPSVKENGEKVARPITLDDVRKHLAGEQTINLQSVNPVGNTCKWMALDADYVGSAKHLGWLAEEMRDDGLHPIYETSRRGGHLWVLFSEPVSARVCLTYLLNVAKTRNVPIKMRYDEVDGLELFPSQIEIPEGGFSSALRAPLGVHRATNLRYWFRGVAPNLPAHIEHLRTLPRATADFMEMLIQGMEPCDDYFQARPAPVTYEFENHLPEPVFKRLGRWDIRPYMDTVRYRKQGKNYNLQCPSCAEMGRDTSKDNLMVAVRDTTLFCCMNNPGCDFWDIRDACKRAMGERTWPRRRF